MMKIKKMPTILIAFRPFDGEHNTENILRLLENASSLGAKGFYCDYHLDLLDAIDLFCQKHHPSAGWVIPIVPNIPEYVRDISSGTVYAGWKRFRRLSFAYKARVFARALFHPRSVLQKDFRVLFPIMLEMELARFAPHRPNLVFLHAQMTDLFLATGARGLFEIFSKVVRSEFGAEPALETNNFHALTKALALWKLPIAAIAAPLNAKGFSMRPSKAACEEAIDHCEMPIYARDITAGRTLDHREAFEYASLHGAKVVILEVTSE